MKTYKKALILASALILFSIVSVEGKDIYTKLIGNSDHGNKNIEMVDEEVEVEEIEADEDTAKACDGERITKRIQQALEDIENAEETINSKAAQGKDVTKALKSIENAKEMLTEAEANLEGNNCREAEKLAKEAKHKASLAKSKDVLSVSPKALMARAFGKCISNAAKEKNFEAFAGCHEEFKKSVNDNINDELSEEDQAANDKVSEAIDALLENVEDEGLIDILNEFKEYNFSGINTDETIAELEEILNSDKSAEEKADELNALLEELKEASSDDKYDDGVIPFNDTDDDDWFFAYADLLKEEACIEGFVNEDGSLTGEFRPGEEVLFGDTLKFVLACMLDEEAAEVQEGESWAVGWASTLLSKYSEYLNVEFIAKVESAIANNEEFALGLSRAEILGFIMDILEIDLPTALETPFSDVPLNHKYVNEIAYALEQGIVSGDEEENTFRPDDIPNRAETVKILIMAKELLGN